MSQYLAATISLVLLLTVSLGGWQGIQVMDARRAVEAALLEAQPFVAAAGGVTGPVRARVLERLQEQGLDPGRATVSGTPPGAPAGQVVWLRVTYAHPLVIPWPGWVVGGDGWRTEVTLAGRAAVPSGLAP